MNLFVYGSLKRGGVNHALLAGAKFLGEARTAPAYRLVEFGPWPALVMGGTAAVPGEVYRVDEDLLRRLDEFEEGYVRGTVRLVDGEAHAYFLA